MDRHKELYFASSLVVLVLLVIGIGYYEKYRVNNPSALMTDDSQKTGHFVYQAEPARVMPFSFDYPEFENWIVVQTSTGLVYKFNGTVDRTVPDRPITIRTDVEPPANMIVHAFVPNPFGLAIYPITTDSSTNLYCLIGSNTVRISIPAIEDLGFSGSKIQETIINSMRFVESPR